MDALEAEAKFFENLIGGLFAELKDVIVHEKLEDDIINDKLGRFLHNFGRLKSLENRLKLITPFLDPLTC